MGYFLVPCPLGGLKSFPGDVFGHAKFIDIFFRNIFSRVQKSTFVLCGGTGNFAKNDQSLKNYYVFTCHSFKSLWTSGCRRHHLGIIFKYKQCLKILFTSTLSSYHVLANGFFPCIFLKYPIFTSTLSSCYVLANYFFP